MIGKNENVMFTKTFTTASSDVTGYLDLSDIMLGEAPTGNQAIGAQFIRVFAVGNNSGGTATLQLVLAGVDTDSVSSGLGVIWRENSTACAADSNRRQDYNNNGSSYVCNVTFTTSGNNMIDLLGLGEQGTKLLLGCTALTGFTSLTVYVSQSRAN